MPKPVGNTIESNIHQQKRRRGQPRPVVGRQHDRNDDQKDGRHAGDAERHQAERRRGQHCRNDADSATVVESGTRPEQCETSEKYPQEDECHGTGRKSPKSMPVDAFPPNANRHREPGDEAGQAHWPEDREYR